MPVTPIVLDAPFFCPVPPAPTVSDSSTIDERSVAWMLRFGLCERDSPLTRIGGGPFTAQCYPYCTRQEYLDIATDLNYLGFAFDDEHVTDPSLRTCEGLAPAIGRLLTVLDSPEAPVEDRYQRALQDVIMRLTRTTTPGNIVQIADGLRKALLYTLWHMSTWQRDELPDLDSYVTVRMNDDGGPWVGAFVPVCGGYELSGTALRDPRFRAVSQAIALVAGIDNDIFSYQREDSVGQKNIIHVLMREHRASVEEAVGTAVDMRNSVMYLYGRLRDSVVADGDPQLGRYVRDIGHLVVGNIRWSQQTARYRTGPANIVPRITTDASGLDLQPLPLRAVSWWWRLL